VVLVNLSTLECKPMTFHALDDDEEDAMTDTATNAE
jgi:hypothetical protein